MTLTPRELEVLRLRKEGKTQLDIAHALGISQPAVSVFKRNAEKKIREADELVKRAKELGLLLLALAFFFSWLMPGASAATPNPGHDASSIGAGTFSSGNYAFPNNVSVAGNISAGQTIYTPQLCLNGDCRTAWPGGAGGNVSSTNGTAGYVARFTNNTNIATGAIYDDGSGKIGIGNTNPVTTLEVAGPIIASTASLRTNHPAAAIQSLGVSGGAYDRAAFSSNAYWDETSQLWIFNNPSVAADAMVFMNDGAMRFVRTAANATYSQSGFLGGTMMTLSSGGDLGIGTTGPAGRLDVRKSTLTANQIDWNIIEGAAAEVAGDNSGVGLKFVHGTSTKWAGIGTASSGGWSNQVNLVFYTGVGAQAERMRITDDGRVGINTTVPNMTLHVVGAANISTLNTAQLCLNSDCKTAWPSGADGSGGWTNNTQNTTTPLNVGIGTSAPETSLHVARDFTWVNTGSLSQAILSGSTDANRRLFLGYDTTSNYGLIQAATKGVGYDKLAINPNGGNVGIGTASPNARLDVKGDIIIGALTSKIDTEQVLVSNTKATTYGRNRPILMIDDQTALAADAGGALGLSGIYTSGNAHAVFGVIEGNKENAADGNFATYLRFMTRANNADLTEQVRIDSQGRLGIGTAAATQKLDVNGSANITSIVYTPQICLNGDCKTSWPTGGSGNATSTGSANYLPYFTNGTNLGNSAIYQLNGQVGVNTTNPSYTLDINSATVPGVHLGTNRQYGGILIDGTYTKAITLAPTSVNSWTMSVDGTDAGGGPDGNFYIQTGLYGSFKELTLRNTGSYGRMALNLNQGTPTATLQVLGEGAGTTPALLVQSSSSPGTANGTVLVALPNGKVGINTSTPTQALDVNGSINVSSASGVLYTPQLCLNGDCKTSWPATGGNLSANAVTGAVAFFNNATQVNGSNNLYWDSTNGRLGIGTNAPNLTLQVMGNGNFTGVLYASNISSNSPLNLMTQGTTRLYIDDTTGYVGIGTRTPGALLHLNRTSGSAGMRLTSSNVSTTFTYNYTGNYQTFIVPPGVTNLTVDVVGATGGGGSGNGQRVNGTIDVTPGQALYLYVGGTTTTFAGGWNGGGDGGNGGTYASAGYGGGGASDIRNNTALSNRTVVAGGGGGKGGDGSSSGGSGGAGSTTGNDGAGTQKGHGGIAGGGSSGVGANGGTAIMYDSSANPGTGGGGGGGGGYVGGGGAASAGCNDDPSCDDGSSGGGGGGGTNLTMASGTTTNSYNSAGNGYIKLSFSPPADYGIDTDPNTGYLRIGRANTTGTESDITLESHGYVGIGTAQPTAKLQVAADGINSTYAAIFTNIGNSATTYGIQVQAGANAGSGTTYYLTAKDGDGDVTGYVQSNAGTFQLVDVSDRATKVGIQKRNFNALDKVKNVDVVEYTRKQNPNGTKITGFVAQDLQKIYPEAVATGPDGKLGVAKAELVPLLFKAIQEQQAEIDALSQGKAVKAPAQTQSGTNTSSLITKQGNDIMIQLGTTNDVVMTLG